MIFLRTLRNSCKLKLFFQKRNYSLFNKFLKEKKLFFNSNSKKSFFFFLQPKMDQKIPNLNSFSSFESKKATIPSSPSSSSSSSSSDLLQECEKLFPDLLEDILSEWKDEPGLVTVLERMKKVCNFNVPFGKKNRALAVVTSYLCLVEGKIQNLTKEDEELLQENIKLAKILGWSVEWLQAFLLVLDDIMDNSLTRRGRPCWYRIPEVGPHIAINDAIFLERCIYSLLRKYFHQKPYYVDLLELFHSVTSQTVLGQSLDLMTSPPEKENKNGVVSFEHFSLERYETIVQWKTAYYSFYLPVALAMHMAGVKEAEAFDEARKILLKMGEYFQIQDDYLDCFGDPEVSGKIGTDIEDNKCSWLLVQALLRVSAEQKVILSENYGQNEAEKVAKVKKLFRELKLEEYFHEYEEQSYQQLLAMIGDCRFLPEKLFICFVEKIYKRRN